MKHEKYSSVSTLGLDDYRNITGTCDVFVSVGMLEHVGREYYPSFGHVIHRVLDPEHGRGLLHFIGRNWPRPLNAWIRQRIFPGAEPPTLAEVGVDIFEPWDLSVLDVENLRLHYARTLGHWLARFEAAEDRVRQMFDDRFSARGGSTWQDRRPASRPERCSCFKSPLPAAVIATSHGREARRTARWGLRGHDGMMDACDVLIVGGGPAGSACAWQLRHAGLDVLVLDKATFPRDKVCAGWITPEVLAELDIAPDVYRDGRVLQPITGFRTGLVGGGDIETLYGRTVSFGIRRCEFDQYLLQRAGARLGTGTPVTSLWRSGDLWIVNEQVRTPLIVGAGGHFCPVARVLNGQGHEGPIVAAQEIEFPLSARQVSSCRVSPETPELYFCSDFQGYGWCFRKQGFLNVGLGRRDRHHLSSHVHEFVDFLQARRKIPLDIPTTWRGHAYRLFESMPRAVLDDGIVLIGDAAGLAYPESGEGIRTGIESGLMAAGTIIAARGRYDRDHLAPYQRALYARYRRPTWPRVLTAAVPRRLVRSAATWLLTQPWFARRVVLDRWFLHTSQPALEPQNGLRLIQPSERRTWPRAS